MKSDKNLRRSPIRQPSLRLPGQSLEERISGIKFNQVLVYASIFGMSVALLIYVWIDYFFPSPIGAIVLTTFLLVGISAFSYWKLCGYRTLLDNLRLGVTGELEVAENIDVLRKEGVIVFHDLIGHGFNVDHVILSRKGIFVVETKTLRKTSSSKVEYDGIRILIDGRDFGRDYLQQAGAEAKWISGEIESATGRRYPIKPVIVFPGWYVQESGPAFQSGVWVKNPKALVTIIQKQPDVLSEEDVRLAAYFLSRMNR